MNEPGPANQRFSSRLKKLLVWGGCLLSTAAVVAQGIAPFVNTQRPNFTWTAITLNGMAVPNGLSTVAWFEWGPRGHFEMRTPATEIGDGGLVARVEAQVSGLATCISYQYRLVASNTVGITYGAAKVMDTGRRLVSWLSAGVPGSLTNVVSIACGSANMLAVTGDGSVRDGGGCICHLSVTRDDLAACSNQKLSTAA